MPKKWKLRSSPRRVCPTQRCSRGCAPSPAPSFQGSPTARTGAQLEIASAQCCVGLLPLVLETCGLSPAASASELRSRGKRRRFGLLRCLALVPSTPLCSHALQNLGRGKTLFFECKSKISNFINYISTNIGDMVQIKKSTNSFLCHFLFLVVWPPCTRSRSPWRRVCRGWERHGRGLRCGRPCCAACAVQRCFRCCRRRMPPCQRVRCLCALGSHITRGAVRLRKALDSICNATSLACTPAPASRSAAACHAPA